MDRDAQLAAELRALRKLCNEAAPREARQGLMDSLRRNTWIEPEHQIVFESIRALFPRGPISETQLRVHLTKRGFPDTDVEKYFQPATGARIHPAAAKKTVP
jgi:hypothetical protein